MNNTKLTLITLLLILTKSLSIFLIISFQCFVNNEYVIRRKWYEISISIRSDSNHALHKCFLVFSRLIWPSHATWFSVSFREIDRGNRHKWQKIILSNRKKRCLRRRFKHNCTMQIYSHGSLIWLFINCTKMRLIWRSSFRGNI